MDEEVSTPIYDRLVNSVDYHPVCEAFKWIGQSFKHCDDCGRPFWVHTHDDRGSKGLVPITPKMAAQCKERWADS